MPTHQSLGGASDEEFLRRMVDTYPERFGEPYWRFFDAHVAPFVPKAPTILDIGCGPALFLNDLGERYPSAALFGYDVTPAMVDHGNALACAGAKPRVTLLDASTEALPHADGSVDLVSLSSVLHVFDEPLPALAEVRRVLKPSGVLLLNDWVRQPLAEYLKWRHEAMGEPLDVSRKRGFRLFMVHAKYTVDDWRWLLGEAGFAIRHHQPTRASHEIFVVTPAR